MIIHG